MNDQHTNTTALSTDLLPRLRRLEAAEAGRKRRSRAIGRALAIGVIATAVALPGVATALGDAPNVFADGDLLSAAEMNENFAHVVAAVTALEDAPAPGPDVFCGVTADVDGDVGGYEGGAGMCADACGIADAHICTTHELVRIASAGGSVPQEGWAATGVYSNWTNNGTIDDCVGFTGGTGVELGTTWRPDNTPGTRYCSANHPLLCCAAP